MTEILGSQFGFRIEPPLAGQPGNQVTLLTEDDDVWHPVTSFHAIWLKDLIFVATEAQRLADTRAYGPTACCPDCGMKLTEDEPHDCSERKVLMVNGPSCRKCGRNISRDDKETWDERCPADPSGSHNE